MGQVREATEVHDWQVLAEELLAAEGDEVERRGNPTHVRVYEGRVPGPALRLETNADPRFLVGWVAPPECVAVALVATGRAHVTDDGAGRAERFARDEARVRLCCVVSRSGRVGWTMTGFRGRTETAAPTEGRLLDALKRCFALPTSPPDTPAAELHAAAWAASILEQAVESDRQLTWSDVAQAHPLARLLRGDLPSTPDNPREGSDDLADLVRIAANAWSRQEIRAQACDGNLRALVHPAVAAWMDEGMFSRWMLGRVPPLDQLTGALRAYLTPSAADRLESALG